MYNSQSLKSVTCFSRFDPWFKISENKLWHKHITISNLVREAKILNSAYNFHRQNSANFKLVKEIQSIIKRSIKKSKNNKSSKIINSCFYVTTKNCAVIVWEQIGTKFMLANVWLFVRTFIIIPSWYKIDVFKFKKFLDWVITTWNSL